MGGAIGPVLLMKACPATRPLPQKRDLMVNLEGLGDHGHAPGSCSSETSTAACCGRGAILEGAV